MGPVQLLFLIKAPKYQAGSEVDSQTPEQAQFCAIVGLEPSLPQGLLTITKGKLPAW